MSGKVAFLLGSEAIKKFESGRIDEAVKRNIFEFEYLREEDKDALINGVQFGLGKPNPVTVIKANNSPLIFNALIESGQIMDDDHVALLFGMSGSDIEVADMIEDHHVEIVNTWGNEELFLKGVLIAAGNDDLFYEEDEGDLFHI